MSAHDPSGDHAGELPLVALLRALIADTRTLIEAEAGYWRVALGYALGRVKQIALLAVLALFFGFFALMALVVGLLLALAPLVGAWGALGLVTGVLALLAAGCAWLMIRRTRRMIALLGQSVL